VKPPAAFAFEKACKILSHQPFLSAKLGANPLPPLHGTVRETMNWAYVLPIVLLCCSNVFMTFAWYGQLKYPNTALWILIPVSWSIAFFEYCFAVPANHIGHRVYSAAQLKTMQEVITLVVFAIFSATYLGEPLKWNHAVAFGLIVLAAYFAFEKF
jgi:uncharacterized protein (DUF486 family)